MEYKTTHLLTKSVFNPLRLNTDAIKSPSETSLPELLTNCQNDINTWKIINGMINKNTAMQSQSKIQFKQKRWYMISSWCQWGFWSAVYDMWVSLHWSWWTRNARIPPPPPPPPHKCRTSILKFPKRFRFSTCDNISGRCPTSHKFCEYLFPYCTINLTGLWQFQNMASYLWSHRWYLRWVTHNLHKYLSQIIFL